jgi:hypothetical protein
VIKTAVFLLCFCTLNVFSQTAQQPTREDLVAAGSVHGRRYVNTAVGLTYDLPKSVEVDSKFAAMASASAVLAALDRKWKQGSHENMVLLSVGASEISPEQQVTSKVAPLQQQPGFRWIEQPHEARVGDVSGWLAAWELNTAAAVFATRRGRFMLVWGLGATDEKSLRELIDSVQTVRFSSEPLASQP